MLMGGGVLQTRPTLPESLLQFSQDSGFQVTLSSLDLTKLISVKCNNYD